MTARSFIRSAIVLLTLSGSAAMAAPTTCDQPAAGERTSVSTDAEVADFARLLTGTWVRRLTIGGVPVQTDSFFYFDLPEPATGRGEAFMIDRINQGWDDQATTIVPASAGQAASAAGTATEPPTTTGGYWSVSITPATNADGKGHRGVTLALAGDYRGTGPEYPPAGFRFTETGTFYAVGTTYATRGPWRAPPMAQVKPGAGDSASFTAVDAVIVTKASAQATGSGAVARPTLTYILCQDGIVDRYYKLSDARPRVGSKTLKAAWAAALAAGTFKVGAAQ